MRFLGPILIFGGYCLVYAAVAHGGVFATDPWNGIFADAYIDSASGEPGAVVTGPGGAITNAGNEIGSALGTQNFSRPRG